MEESTDEVVAVPEAEEPKVDTRPKVVDAGEVKPKPGRDEWQEYKRLKAEAKAAKAAAEERAKTASKWESIEGKLKDDPLSVLDDLGLSLDDLITRKVGGNEGDNYERRLTKMLEDRLSTTKKEMEEQLNAREQKLQQKEEAAHRATQERAFVDYVGGSGGKYAFMSKAGSEEYVPLAWEAAKALSEHHGKAPTQDEICEEVEAYLQHKYGKWSTPQPAEPRSTKPVVTRKASIGGISNAHTPDPQASRRAQAIAALREIRRAK
jgi:hypothetical protein